MEVDDISSKADKIQNIIQSVETDLKSIQVDKDIPLEIDVGNLLAFDSNELDKNRIKDEEEEYFKSLARDGVQAILNKVWDLPSERKDHMIYADLPKPATRLPREKKLPKPKRPTRWEVFAKEKGIRKKKKPSKVWDDVLKEWIPRFGYAKVKAERKKNWLKELPGNANPMEDQIRKASEAKKERIAKNEYQRLRNLAKHKNVEVPKVGITAISSKQEMQKTLAQTRVSTASLGKFQQTLNEDKPLNEFTRGKKRKLPASDNSAEGIQQEKKRYLEILHKMNKKELNLEGAVHEQIKMENVEMSQKPPKRLRSDRRSKHGVRKRGKSEYKAGSKKSLVNTLKNSKRGKGKSKKGGGSSSKGNSNKKSQDGKRNTKKNFGGKRKSLAGKSRGGKGRKR